MGGHRFNPIDEHMKNTAHLRKLNALAGKVRDLERKLKALHAQQG